MNELMSNTFQSNSVIFFYLLLLFKKKIVVDPFSRFHAFHKLYTIIWKILRLTQQRVCLRGKPFSLPMNVYLAKAADGRLVPGGGGQQGGQSGYSNPVYQASLE